eukprot:1195428-Prorocentrum_minimum.AAC.5
MLCTGCCLESTALTGSCILSPGFRRGPGQARHDRAAPPLAPPGRQPRRRRGAGPVPAAAAGAP